MECNSVWMSVVIFQIWPHWQGMKYTWCAVACNIPQRLSKVNIYPNYIIILVIQVEYYVQGGCVGAPQVRFGSDRYSPELEVRWLPKCRHQIIQKATKHQAKEIYIYMNRLLFVADHRDKSLSSRSVILAANRYGVWLLCNKNRPRRFK